MTITQFKEATPNELADTLKASFRQIVKEELTTLKQDLQPQKKPEYISRHEVAEFLGVSTVTVDSWTKKGRLTAYRIGNRVRFNRSEVEQSLTKI